MGCQQSCIQQDNQVEMDEQIAWPIAKPNGGMLYYITWQMYADKKWECMKAFSQMTEEDDEQDHGKSIKMHGRWHAVGGGSGVCICETDDIEALTAWMVNWAEMCDIKVTPVVNDALVRSVVSNKINQ